jgi:CRP-like cAMP-binding protein
MLNYKETPLYKKIIDYGTISDESAEMLFGLIYSKSFKKGDFLLKEGQVCKEIYFVNSGFLRTVWNKDGTEINTGFTLENNFTTNLKSLRNGIPSEVSIQAGENTSVCVFEKDKLADLYQKSREIETFGRNLVEQLLILQEEHSNLFKIHSPAERYAFLEQHRPELLQRVSLSQIASYLGMARETLSRIRKQ